MEQLQVVEMKIKGMPCDSCQAHVEHALRSVPGVATAKVPGWKSGRATVTAAPGVTAEQLTESVREAGYRADELSLQSESPKQPAGDWGRDVDYDLVVIGTGGGGMAAAIRAAELGRTVCIIESGVNIRIMYRSFISVIEKVGLVCQQGLQGSVVVDLKRFH